MSLLVDIKNAFSFLDPTKKIRDTEQKEVADSKDVADSIEYMEMSFKDFIGEDLVAKKEEPPKTPTLNKTESSEEVKHEDGSKNQSDDYEPEDAALDKINALIQELKLESTDDYLKQLQAVYECFMMIKRCMNIPMKPERNKLVERDEPLTTGEAIKLRLILQDRIVLHHVQFIDDIDELIKIITKIKTHPRQEKDLKVKFENKIKFILNDIHDKEKYLLKKQPHLATLDLGKIEEVFNTYCDNCSYHLSTSIPEIFKRDFQLVTLGITEKEQRDNLNDNIREYFGRKLTTNRRVQRSPLIQYNQSKGERAKKKIHSVLESLTATKERLGNGVISLFTKLRGSDEKVRIPNSQGIQELDNIAIKLITGDHLSKQTLKAIRARVKVLQKIYDECEEKRLELEQLQKEIKELQPIGLDLLSKSRQLMTNYINTQQDSDKNLEAHYINEKRGFDSQVEKLKLLKEQLQNSKLKEHEDSISKDIQLQQELISAIHDTEKKLELKSALNISVITACEKFEALKKEWGKKFKPKNTKKDLDAYLKEYEEEANKQKARRIELQEIQAQLDAYGKAREFLKGKTLNSAQIDSRIEHIKKQAEQYWSGVMKVQIEPQMAQFEPQILAASDEHIPLIENHYKNVEDRLARALQDNGSFITKLLSGMSAVAVGAAIGGVAGGLTSLNPFKAAYNVGIGAILGGAIGGVIYATWLSSQGKTHTAELQQEFMNEMEKVGFNNKEYTELINDVMKLLIHRDCLLLNEKLAKSDNKKLRDEFIEKEDLKDKTKEEIDLAIERYFAKQLNKLIDESFTKIYDLHEEDINDAKKESEISAFLKKFFKGGEEYAKQRQICTTQMQIAFLEAIAHCLTSSKDLISKKYRAFCCVTAAVFLGTAIGLGIAIGTGPVGIGIIVGCSIAAVLALAATKISKFKYIRSSSDRNSLDELINILKAEANKLKKMAAEVVNTGLKHQQSLVHFIKSTKPDNILVKALRYMIPDAFENVFALLCKDWKDKQIAMCTADGWLREWSERYRHSVFMEVDFANTLKPIVLRAANQTQELQQELVKYMIVKNRIQGPDPLNLLNKYIKDTTDFLNAKTGPENKLKNALKDFFNYEVRIKEQILEIVSVTPMEHGNLPDELVAFYKNVLGGSEQDLYTMRRLNNLDAVRTAIGETKKEDMEIKEQDKLKQKMEAHEKPILGGSKDYRIKLGSHNNNAWGEMDVVCAKSDEAKSITPDNIKQYLENSLEFMIALDKQAPDQPLLDSLDDECAHDMQYIIYRAMFLNQLAELLDPAHAKYQPALKETINNFVKYKLLLDNPEKFFLEIQHQNRVVPPPAVKVVVVKAQLEAKQQDAAAPNQVALGDANLEKTYNDSIVDAIRVCLTYDKNKMTPKHLIERYITPRLITDKLFGFKKDKNTNILQTLGNSTCTIAVETLEKTISNTEKLFYAILNHSILKNYKVHMVFFNAAMEDINQLDKDISDRLKKENILQNERKNLSLAQSKLQLHKKKLQLIQKFGENIISKNDEEKHNSEEEKLAEPTLYFTSHKPSLGRLRSFFASSNTPVGPADNATEEEVKSALLNALSQSSGSNDNPIMFNLNCLTGDEPWKKNYLGLLGKINDLTPPSLKRERLVPNAALMMGT